MEMKEIGQILKETREAKGISYDEIYEAEKIQKKYLIAIENGDETAFVAKVYYLSFMKAYAKYLDLNFDETYEAYLTEKAKMQDETDNSDKNKQNQFNLSSMNKMFSQNFKESVKAKKHIIFIIAPIIILIGSFLYISDNKTIVIEENNDEISADTINDSIERNTEDIEYNPESAPAKPINNIPETPITTPIQSYTVPKGASNLPIPSAPAPAKAVDENRHLALSSISQNQGTLIRQQDVVDNTVYSNLNTIKQKLVIVAIDDVWVGIRIDGRTVFEGDIASGAQMTWEADEVFRIRAGKGLAIRVYFNDQEIDPNIGINTDSTKTLILRKQR
jgi:cytoskeletal protein RodZ